MFVDAMTGLVTNDGSVVHGGENAGDAAGRILGPVANQLNVSRIGFDPGFRRPYIDKNGQAAVSIRTGRTTLNRGVQVPIREHRLIAPLVNAGMMAPVNHATTLQKEAWIIIDDAVVRARRNRLRAWDDLVAASSRGGFDGMAKTTIEYHSMNDPGQAYVDMDGITDGTGDRPLFILSSCPLPITHSDFTYTEREIAESRNTSTPLDTTGIEWATRRVVETVEKTLIGTVTGMTYGTQTAGPGTHRGTSTSYGYTNFPYRVTKTGLATPDGTNPQAVLADVLSMIETMQTNGYYGPYVLYHSTGYSQYLNNDYFRTGSTSAVRSLRERLMEIDDLQDIRRLDFLTTNYQLVLVQMVPEVVQAVNGLDLVTMQWDTKGGLAKNFKVMCIYVPLLKAPYNGITGILHGST